MPTRTFMNLPKEKRIRILKAAKKEFSRVPLEKAIIANIVKDARIPRGSFYQYFDSIEDLFVYLIDYMYGIDKRKFVRDLEATDNDFYEALKLRFSDSIDKLANHENRQFRLNIMATLFNGSHNLGTEVIDSISKVDQIIDPDYCPQNIKNAKNSSKFMGIIKMIGKSCTEKFLSNSQNADLIKEEYNKYIDLVKGGFTGSL